MQFLLSGIINLKYEIIFQVEIETVSFFLFAFLNNIVCDSVPLKVKRSVGGEAYLEAEMS